MCVLVSSLWLITVVEAQEPQEAAVLPLEEITVTGSRIQRDGMTTPTPVTVITSVELDKMAPGTLIDSMNQLPQFFNNVSVSDAGSATTAPGASILNLRGLGTNRTLTLLNGRRVVPFNREGAVNISLFPQPAIQRVEVVTGGASAAYGTDAVAGVVNFILDTDFTGVEVEANGGITSRGDAETWEVSAIAGRGFGDRVHVIVSGGAYEQTEVSDWEGRDWYQSWAPVRNPTWPASGPEDIIAPQVVATNFTCGGLISARGSALDRLTFDSDGSYHKFVLSDLSSTARGGTNNQSLAAEFGGGDGCDPSSLPGNTGLGGARVSNGVVRVQGFGHLDFDVNEDLTLFVEGFYSQDEVESRANTAIMRSLWGATIFQDNAFLPTVINDIMIAEGLQSFSFNRFNADISQGRFKARNQTSSITAGFNVEIESDGFFDGWKVDGYYQFGKNDHRLQLMGYMRIETLFVALDAVVDPATGSIVCRAALIDPGRWGNCKPLNVFGVGNASREAIEYVTTPTNPNEAITQFVELEEQDAEINASGEIWEGWGAGPVSVAFGASWRDQTLNQFQGPAELVALDTPTNATLGVRGVPPGFAGDPDIHQFASITELTGSIDVKEAYAEVLVPLVSDGPFADQLDFSGAVRWADYSGSGTIWAYKVGLDWNLTTDFRFRGTFSRDVRAANLSERFDTTRALGSVNNDPVTGLSFDFSQTTGGNPEVNPETAETLTIGGVYQPSWLDGFSISLDWYDIDISGAIGQLSTQRIIDDCFAGAAQLCALITRDPTTGVITDLRNVFININKETAKGIDLEVSYNTEFRLFGGGNESLNVRGFLGYLYERATSIPGAPVEDIAGDILEGMPEWQGTVMVTYRNGPFSLFLQERYIGDGLRDTDEVEGIDIDENDVPAVWYTNLRLTYEIGSSWEIFGHVANLFDKDPPIVAGTWSGFSGSSQTNRSLYDVNGRTVFLGASMRY